jgi:hypothetical protein
MARKRKAKAASGSAAYRLGFRRGQRALELRLKRKRKAAALKGAKTRAERKKRPRPPTVAVEAGEILLYEAPAEEAALFHLDWREFPVNPTAWAVHAAILLNGAVVAEQDFSVEPEWDKEAAAATVRRELRAWIKTYHAEHPESEGYQATVFHLALRAV